MKIVIAIIGTIVSMVIWTAIAFTGTIGGWWHKMIAEEKTSQAFIDAVEQEIAGKFVGNFAMAVMADGSVEVEKFHSVGKPVDRTTVFQVSSLSKWVSAVGIMKLVEQGRLELDAPVRKYLTRWQLPASVFNNEEVTVRRLLSHTAGLTDGLGYSGFEAGTPLQTLEQSLTLASDADEGVSGAVHVGIKPGSAFKYSGGGYTLLQLIVEEVTDRSFSTFMKESVFDPLGMTQSRYVWNDSSDLALAEFYNDDGSAAKHYRYTSLAATSLYTSLSDLEIFFQVHMNGSRGELVGRGVLSPETVKMMRAPHAQSMGADIWGLGTVLFASSGDSDFIIGHDGKSTPAINTAVRLDPATGNGIIVLETGNASLATSLASEWVFWKTGQVDNFLFIALVPLMIRIILAGWVLIVVLGVLGYLRFRTH
jgi:CubicO group peptidase (beta-lactamase class C family)